MAIYSRGSRGMKQSSGGGGTDELGCTTTFTNNGNTITETYSDGSVKTTVMNANGSITETYPSGKVFTTTFSADGNTITKAEVTS